MRRLAFLFVMIISVGYSSLFAQNNVGIGTTTPDASAILDIESNSLGLLIPRVTLIDVFDATSPVNAPATGLLVFNSAGALTQGFYYWDGSEWILVGAGGGGGCSTLDEAYDCGGAGVGRAITADAGSLEITLPLTGTNDYAIEAFSNKGTLAAPTAAVFGTNNNHGVGVYAEITDVTNLYSAVQGVTYTTQTSADLPTGVTGFHDGTGRGVGVWGEANSSNAAGSSYGIYGNATGTSSFGGYFYGADFPGAFIESDDLTGVALQIAGAGDNPLNWGMLCVGATQINCGNSGAATGNNIIFNNAAGEATMGPDMGGWCYLGGPSLEWWGIYTSNAVQVSRRELKRDINYLDEDLSEYVIDDIMKMKPAFYKYNAESDEIIAGKESKSRLNMHMGFILDETPDYVQDNAFSGIDLYGLSTLAISGVQHNRRSIVELEEKIETVSTQINDFGIATISGNEVRVNYNKDFQGNIPVVSVTPNSPVNNYYIKSQDESGFTLGVENIQNFQFNWIAMAIFEIKGSKENEVLSIDPVLLNQLEVDETRKQLMNDALMIEQSKPLELVGKEGEKPSAKRFSPKLNK